MGFQSVFRMGPGPKPIFQDRGVQPRVPKYCFFLFFLLFFVFSRFFFGFLGFLHGASPQRVPNIVFFFLDVFFLFLFIFSMGPPPKESPNIVFLGFFWVSRVFFYLFLFSPWGLPPKSPQIFFCFFFLEVFFLVFSMGPLPKESPFEPDNEVKQTMLTKIWNIPSGGFWWGVWPYIYIHIYIPYGFLKWYISHWKSKENTQQSHA